MAQMWVVIILKIGISLILTSVVNCSEITTFEVSKQPSVLSCDKIKVSDNIACICVTGLWRLYGDCTTYDSVAGNSHCIQDPRVLSEKHRFQRVTYAMEVLPNMNAIAVIRDESKVIRLMTEEESGIKTLIKLLHGDVIVTGSPHTVKGLLGSVCLHPQERAYCTYTPQDFIGGDILTVENGCDEDLPFISPISCVFEKESQSCHESAIASRLGEHLENEVEVDAKRLKRYKRDSWSTRKSRRDNSRYGRTFLGLPDQTLDRNVTTLQQDDEDYLSQADFELANASSTEVILSEVWNYIDMQAGVAMGMRQPTSRDLDYNIPYFKLLHMSKRVMQKACPAEYVPPGFFDVAVQTFIQVLVKRLVYEEQNANLPGFKRIAYALEQCANQITPYPFLIPDNNTCDPNSTGQGQFNMFNRTQDLNITDEFIGLDREPIVETVWKVFFATTLYCFPYFQPPSSSFNDHHRYISWISSLFIGGIQDIWQSSNGTNMTYGQFLGDITVVMEKVAYCAASARFTEIELEYPKEWNLVRPTQNSTTTRRKRSYEAPAPSTSCLSTSESSRCFSNTKPHDESFLVSSQQKQKAPVRTVQSFDIL